MNALDYLCETYIGFSEARQANPDVGIEQLPGCWALDQIDFVSWNAPLVAIAVAERIVQLAPDSSATGSVALGWLPIIMNSCPEGEVEIGVQMVRQSEQLKSILEHLWMNGLESAGREFLRRVRQ